MGKISKGEAKGMSKSTEQLDSICLKRKKRTQTYEDIKYKLEVYDRIITSDTSKPFIESIKKDCRLSKVDWMCLKFMEDMQDHLWTTIAILSTKNQTANVQNIRDGVVKEITEKILTPSYFDFCNENFEQVLEYIKDAIKTYFKVVRIE